ncbi:Cu_bind_like domain-containing protein [Cephalotus follicularis]|uniref:Cu_bind_like domain-containing protein n=1 Tax=Cephalotus follicularis TaxID=3775 RepID=A0A1Q3BU06_CEPFO|nr:Cu_bind_like domain-containing protein [Cephalotus follicularis]
MMNSPLCMGPLPCPIQILVDIIDVLYVLLTYPTNLLAVNYLVKYSEKKELRIANQAHSQSLTSHSSQTNMSSSSSAHFILSCFITLIFAIATISPTAATDHIVGANKGWNPGVNYTLWASNHTFYVGDLISFRYQKNQYNVFEVNQTGYDNCTTDGAVGNWTSGKDFILLDKAMRYYFICGNGQCYNGMKVSVLVHPLPPPPSASTAKQTSAATLFFDKGLVGLRALVVAFVSIWFGSGWI